MDNKMQKDFEMNGPLFMRLGALRIEIVVGVVAPVLWPLHGMFGHVLFVQWQ